MTVITLEVIWKLPGRDFSPRTVLLEQKTTVRDLLFLLDMEAMSDRLIIAYNGACVTLDDCLERDGRVIIVPVICGG